MKRPGGVMQVRNAAVSGDQAQHARRMRMGRRYVLYGGSEKWCCRRQRGGESQKSKVACRLGMYSRKRLRYGRNRLVAACVCYSR